jgi:hypothetical protein
MKKETELSRYYNPDHNRRATVAKDDYHYVVRLYENEKLKRTELLENHSIFMAEDLAENWVQRYGAFK